MPEINNNIKLSHGSIEMLASILGAAGWTSKRREMTAAGQLGERLEQYADTRPVYTGEVVNNTPVDQMQFANFRRVVRSWEREAVDLTITDSEFQACMSCLRHFTDEKKIPSNYHGAELLTTFRLSE